MWLERKVSYFHGAGCARIHRARASQMTLQNKSAEWFNEYRQKREGIGERRKCEVERLTVK